MDIGTVIKISGKNSVKLKTERSVTHPVYKKRIVITSEVFVHDPIGVQVGDVVKFESCRPISKMKKHIIKEKV